jgi:hypothetical protein
MCNQISNTNAETPAVLSTDLLAESLAFAREKLAECNLEPDGYYSVSRCGKCGKLTLWGGEMKGERVTECRKCEYEQIHSFIPLPR